MLSSQIAPQLADFIKTNNIHEKPLLFFCATLVKEVLNSLEEKEKTQMKDIILLYIKNEDDVDDAEI